MKDLLFNWKNRIFIVKPETVIKWYRTEFRFYWRWGTKSKVGRLKTDREVIALNKKMVNENQLWGAPKIHGELKKLEYDVSESTVQRYLPKRGKRTNGQN